MRHDILADVFCAMKNAETIGRHECIVSASKLIKGVLDVIQKHNYIGKYEFIEDGKGGKFKIGLIGKINNCNVIRPRFSIQINDIIKWEKRFLPAENVGILILTTPKGIIDQREAGKLKTGGRLLGFVY